MCGRARCTLQREEVARLAGVASEAFVDGDKYRPCENMGPGRYGPVTFRARDADVGGDDKKDWQKHKKLQAMRWGLVPSFTKPTVKPDHFIMFNARSESLHERPAFRRLLETRRCVILSEGYYEWQQVDKREKQPYYIYRENAPLKFAGLYDSWLNEDGEMMYTYTILTTEISPEMSWMHTRMPVILTDDGATRWLSDAKFDTLRDLLVAYRGEDLTWHPVGRKVGSTKFQSEDCSKKVDIKHAANIASFFESTSLKKLTPPRDSEGLDMPSKLPPESSCGKPESAGAEAICRVPSQSSTVAQPASVTSSPVKPMSSKREEQMKSPIKFLFQQQHMVQQAEEIMAASSAASSTTTGSAKGSSNSSKTIASSFIPASKLVAAKRPISPSRSNASPKKRKASPKKTAGKNPQRGTLLAFFQPQS